jgi:hypothetical protein
MLMTLMWESMPEALSDVFPSPFLYISGLYVLGSCAVRCGHGTKFRLVGCDVGHCYGWPQIVPRPSLLSAFSHYSGPGGWSEVPGHGRLTGWKKWGGSLNDHVKSSFSHPSHFINTWQEKSCVQALTFGKMVFFSI